MYKNERRDVTCYNHSMENFFFGITAIKDLAVSELSILAQSLVVRGFVAGYVVATLMFGFVYTRSRDDACPLPVSQDQSTNHT